MAKVKLASGREVDASKVSGVVRMKTYAQVHTDEGRINVSLEDAEQIEKARKGKAKK